MRALTPIQRRRREQAESLIRVLAPFLDLVLAAGERVSRVVERGDDDYYPPQRGRIPPARAQATARKVGDERR
jgi:hypothetical protein